jgi:glycogen debranching enzyme
MTNRMLKQLVRLRPRDDTLHVCQGRTVLATSRDGFIYDGPEHGMFVHETRLLSRFRHLIDGNPPRPVALSNVEQHSWLGYYLSLPPQIEVGERDRGSGQMQEETEQTLELRLSRYVGDGLHEDIDLTNFSQQTTSFRFELEIDADFADVVETKGEREQKGEVTREWRAAGDEVWELAFDYKAEHPYDHQGERGTARIHRGLTLRVENSSSEPRSKADRVIFDVTLGPLASWHACLNFIPFIDGARMEPLYGCRSFTGTHNEHDRRREIFLADSTSFTTPETETLAHVLTGALEQARRDLASLRLYDLDQGERAWTMAAGLPVYVALFGRDTLTASWQAGLASTDMMRGTLPVLAGLQGAEVNDWRDEQPGRMLHEAHTGPLEMLNFNPRRRYYGSVTTSGFYPVVVSELWHWTGDKDLVRGFIRPAMSALAWLDEYADMDGDGFYEYKTSSKQGVRNQGWKDSGNAIVYEDGSQVEPPIATCEEQAFAYLAKLHLSELLWWLDEKDAAKRLYTQATELKKRFNDRFWMEEDGYLAMGLDSQKRQIKSIGSNAGHCLATAIVDESLALRIVGRFIADDMFTGWGIRTLSSKHPAYNPFSYHRGSVWPVEHGTFALAFMRYGLRKHVDLICRAQLEAAALFDFYRLPELFSGHPRDTDHPFPAYYPFACSPQAWSASAIFCFMQAMLGLYPYAPLNLLLLDPHLPDWLPDITLRNLRVGEARCDIRFYRAEDGSSDYEVLEKRGALHILRQPSPWSLTSSFAERLKDTLTSLIK